MEMYNPDLWPEGCVVSYFATLNHAKKGILVLAQLGLSLVEIVLMGIQQ